MKLSKHKCTFLFKFGLHSTVDVNSLITAITHVYIALYMVAMATFVTPKSFFYLGLPDSPLWWYYKQNAISYSDLGSGYKFFTLLMCKPWLFKNGQL